MKITSVKTYPIKMPLKHPFRIALGERKNYEGVLIKIETDVGICGIGEAAPSAKITGETPASALAAIDRFVPILLGKNPERISAIMEEVNSNLLYNYSAKCAIDIALHDISGKTAQKPLKDLLGVHKDKIETDITIGLKSIRETIIEAREILSSGFRILKVKIGEDTGKDVEKIKELRGAVGEETLIRVDANQGYTVNEAMDVAETLARYKIEFMEQPVQFWDVDGMRRVRNSSPIPIMADESIHAPYDALRLVREEACDYFNIKLMRVGGIREAAKIASIAEDGGIKCMVGCMGESEIGIAAAAHFALATRTVAFADLDSHLMLKERISEGGLSIESGICAVSDRPGIGIFWGFD